MRYGTIKKYRDSKLDLTLELHTELYKVDDEAQVLSEFIRFIRIARKEGYQDATVRFETYKETGRIKKLITEYSIAVDE